MARALRIPLFERQLTIRLSAAAIALLFDSAAVLSEGEFDIGFYGGSTMITIDLARLSNQLSEACDIATARKLEVLLARDPRVRARAIALAKRAARDRVGALEITDCAVRCHRDGRHLHIDIDIEGRPEDRT